MWLIEHENDIRLSIFLFVLVVMMLWEIIAKKKILSSPRKLRWFNNLSIVVLNSVLLRIAFPIMAVGLAAYAEQQQWGLWWQLAGESAPAILFGIMVLISVILLDLVVYWQHRIFHHVPFLWRLHRMHHADTDIDVTTALRFHPIEIMLSMLVKMAIVMLLGIPVIAVIIFEIILNASAMFNHANIKLSATVDRYLRIYLVTPDMHRVHHSIIPLEHHNNFGFCLSCWDRWFGSYIAQPEKGHTNMRIGLPYFREEHWKNIARMLWMPFIK